MLQRIYGTAWESPEQLVAYVNLKAEAARRDHRKLGQELDLFSIQESAGGWGGHLPWLACRGPLLTV
jgi:threonyl-tRNA synthetase